MESWKGRLVYSGSWLDRPWKLVRPGESDTDLFPMVQDFLVKANEQPASYTYGADFCEILCGTEQPHRLYYNGESGLVIQSQTGVFNLRIFFEDVLIRLSGRLVILEVSIGKLRIAADPDEIVYSVALPAHGNDAWLPDRDARQVCDAFGNSRCIFLRSRGPQFRCGKFSDPYDRAALQNLHRGGGQAVRVGSCKFHRVGVVARQ